MLLCDPAWLEKRITANQYANIPTSPCGRQAALACKDFSDFFIPPL